MKSRTKRGVKDSRRTVFVRNLLSWYTMHGRHNLPWRRTRDPWLTLLAPIMLRKTTVSQVCKIYSEFALRFPTPSALAVANLASVEDLIRPLGMERQRSAGLINVAKELVLQHRGTVPATLERLKQLPLVGDYAAREVLCIAFGRDEPMLDRNMIRVIQRVFGVESEKKRAHTDSKLWDFSGGLIPRGRGREFNYAVLDLASAVCKAASPLCSLCPMVEICRYAEQRGLTTQ